MPRYKATDKLTVQDIDGMTVMTLRYHLKQKKLTVSGKKADIQQRLKIGLGC